MSLNRSKDRLHHSHHHHLILHPHPCCVRASFDCEAVVPKPVPVKDTRPEQDERKANMTRNQPNPNSRITEISPIVRKLQILVYFHLFTTIASMLSGSSWLLDGFEVLLWSYFLFTTLFTYFCQQFYDNKFVERATHFVLKAIQKLSFGIHHWRSSLSLHELLHTIRLAFGKVWSLVVTVTTSSQSEGINDSYTYSEQSQSKDETISILTSAAPERIDLDRGGRVVVSNSRSKDA